jgi:hypothetical protein
VAGPFGDELLSASVEALLDPAKTTYFLVLLRQSCDAGEQLSCALLLRRIAPGAEKSRRYEKLYNARHEASRFSWTTLVFEVEGKARKQLAQEALKRFPDTDLFFSAAEFVPERAEGLRLFVDNPTYMTLLALGISLIRAEQWKLLNQAMQLALFTGNKEITGSGDYWLLRARVATRLKDETLAWAYGAVAVAVTSSGRNTPEHLLSLAHQAARNERSVHLVEVILGLPNAAGSAPMIKSWRLPCGCIERGCIAPGANCW